MTSRSPSQAERTSIPTGRPYAIVAAGIGGTGVVTLNQVLGTAAFLESLVVTALDQTGLSQKGGPVVSHLLLSGEANAGANSVSPQGADLFLALDPVVAVDPRYLAKASPERTSTVASSSLVPTISMVLGDAPDGDVQPLLDTLGARYGQVGFTSVDTVSVYGDVFGDSIGANLIALGAAYQAGLVPLPAESLESAIRINGSPRRPQHRCVPCRPAGGPRPSRSGRPGVPVSCVTRQASRRSRPPIGWRLGNTSRRRHGGVPPSWSTIRGRRWRPATHVAGVDGPASEAHRGRELRL